MEKKILIWGAGKIGRGFVADIFYSAGYKIIFADADQHVVDLLNQHGEYTVLKYKDADDKSSVKISGYEALNINQQETLIQHALTCEAMSVAVFPGALETIAKIFAVIIKRRVSQKMSSPLNVIMCANIQGPSEIFRAYILKHLSEEEARHFNAYIGLMDSVVIRISVQPTEQMLADDPLVVLTNGYEPLTIDGTAVKDGKLCLAGIAHSDKIHAEEVRKMYTYNMLHALYAYLGFVKGYGLVEESIRDAGIQECAVGALNEIGGALIREYGFTEAEMTAWNRDVLKNLANPILKDRVDRLGADVMRKLAYNDRLTGPAILCKKYGIKPYNLTKAIAYAFLFDPGQNENDAAVKAFAAKNGGIQAAEQYCGLGDEPELLNMISEHYDAAHAQLIASDRLNRRR